MTKSIEQIKQEALEASEREQRAAMNSGRSRKTVRNKATNLTAKKKKRK